MKLAFLLLLSTMDAHASSYSNPKIYWNVPTESCNDIYNNPLIELEKYEILHNEQQRFFGEQIVLLYLDKLDELPMINLKNRSDIRSGGIPQMINRTEYLKAIGEIIQRSMPTESHSGLAIIDLEVFRPDWELHWGNFKVYQTQSMQHVLSRPGTQRLNKTEIMDLARNEFNEAVRWIFTETIRLGRRLRPFATWGYYYYPFIHLDKVTHEAKSDFLRLNNNLDWLWKESGAIFPSFYFGDQIKEKDRHFETVKVVMTEANRISNHYNVPVYCYTKFEYNAYNESLMFDYYDKADICSSIKTMADMGAEGIVIWGTSTRINKRCSNMSNYVNNVLGLSVKIILDQHQKCRDKRCNNHGRCVLKDRHAEKSCVMLEKDDRRDRFRCVCDPEYTGPFCSKHATSTSLWLPTTDDPGYFDYIPSSDTPYKDQPQVPTQSCSCFLYSCFWVVLLWSYFLVTIFMN